MALPYHSFISWKLGPVTIQSFGVMVALAFIVGTFFAVREARKRKLNERNIYNLVFYVLIGAIFGSRLAFFIEYKDQYVSSIDFFKIWHGGLTFVGGLIGALLLTFIYIKKNKLNFWLYADIFAPFIAIGHAIGRIGCILGDGGHAGKLTNMPFGFLIQGHTDEALNGTIRHVTAYYSLIFLAVLFFILVKLKDKKFIKKRKGSLFLSYLLLYSVGRFIIDLVRIDPRYFSLTLTQWLLIVTFLISSYLLINRLRENKSKK